MHDYTNFFSEETFFYVLLYLNKTPLHGFAARKVQAAAEVPLGVVGRKSLSKVKEESRRSRKQVTREYVAHDNLW